MTTAKKILYEHGIDLMELNDDFNTKLLHAMERYADAARKDEAVGFIKWLNNKIGLWSNSRGWENISLNQFYQLYLKHKNEKP